MLRTCFQVLVIYAAFSSARNFPEYDYTEHIIREFARMTIAFRNSLQKLSEETLSINQNDLKGSAILEQYPKSIIEGLPDDEDGKREISINCRFSDSFEIRVPLANFNFSGFQKKDGYFMGVNMTAVFTMKWDEMSPNLRSDIPIETVQLIGKISSANDTWSRDEIPSFDDSFEKIVSFAKENLVNIVKKKINNYIMQENNRKVLSTAYAVCMHPQKKFTEGNNPNAYYMKKIRFDEPSMLLDHEIIRLESLKLDQIWNMDYFNVTLKDGSFDFKLQHLNLMGEIEGLFKIRGSQSIKNTAFSSAFSVSNLLVEGGAKIDSAKFGSIITTNNVRLGNATVSFIHSDIFSKTIKKIFEKKLISFMEMELKKFFHVQI